MNYIVLQINDIILLLWYNKGNMDKEAHTMRYKMIIIYSVLRS